MALWLAYIGVIYARMLGRGQRAELYSAKKRLSLLYVLDSSDLTRLGFIR